MSSTEVFKSHEPFMGNSYYVQVGNEHRFTQNNISFVLSECKHLYEDHRARYLKWKAPGKPERGLFIWLHGYENQIVGYIKSGDIKTAMMFGKMKNSDELPRLWLERWKEKPCLHNGVPNKNAMKLLIGLRKQTPKSYGVTKNGMIYEDKTTNALFQAGLVSGFVKKRTDKGEVRALRTNLVGHEVLCHWAARSKIFAGYLEAYRPKNWERDYAANLVLDAMDGTAKPEENPAPWYLSGSLRQAVMRPSAGPSVAVSAVISAARKVGP